MLTESLSSRYNNNKSCSNDKKTNIDFKFHIFLQINWFCRMNGKWKYYFLSRIHHTRFTALISTSWLYWYCFAIRFPPKCKNSIQLDTLHFFHTIILISYPNLSSIIFLSLFNFIHFLCDFNLKEKWILIKSCRSTNALVWWFQIIKQWNNFTV